MSVYTVRCHPLEMMYNFLIIKGTLLMSTVAPLCAVGHNTSQGSLTSVYKVINLNCIFS